MFGVARGNLGRWGVVQMRLRDEEIVIVNLRQEQKKSWQLAVAFGIGGGLSTVWLNSDRLTAVVATLTTLYAFWLGYFYATEIKNSRWNRDKSGRYKF